jgi:hypothetical protein
VRDWGGAREQWQGPRAVATLHANARSGRHHHAGLAPLEKKVGMKFQESKKVMIEDRYNLNNLNQ